MSGSLAILFVGWAAFLLFGIPAIVLMFRSPARARLLAWLALASGLLQAGYFLFSPFSPYRYSGSNSSIAIYLAMWSGPPIFSGLIAVLGSSYFKRHRVLAIGPKCAKCGYLLFGNESGTCPECGQVVSSQQLEEIRTAARPSDSESFKGMLTPAASDEDRQGSGFGRRLVLTLAIGGPLSVVGFVCGALAVHAGDFFKIPYFIFCPFISLFYFGTSYLPLMLRKAIHEGMTKFESVALFCLLQFLFYFLLFSLVDRLRHAARRRISPPKPMPRQRRAALAGVASLVLIVVASLAYLNRSVSFEAASWKQLSKEDRGQMAKDLVASGCLIGRSTSQVLQLLGRPTEHYFSFQGGKNFLWIDLDANGQYRSRPHSTPESASIPLEPYSPDQWRGRSPSERSGMIQTLSTQPEFFSSKSYDEIIQFLGNPDEQEMIAYHVGRWGRLVLSMEHNQVKYVILQ